MIQATIIKLTIIIIAVKPIQQWKPMLIDKRQKDAISCCATLRPSLLSVAINDKFGNLRQDKHGRNYRK
jgi:hypothetical protein